jgi:hypothetical protein
MTSQVLCTVPQGLLGLPLGPGGALINLLPPSSQAPVNGILLNNFAPNNNGGFQVNVDASAYAAFLTTALGKSLTNTPPGYQASMPAAIIAMN